MSLNILLSKLNADEIEILAEELVDRLCGERPVPLSEPEISHSDLHPSQSKAPKSESESAKFRSQPAAEAIPEAHPESRKLSPALEQILSAIESLDPKPTPDSFLTPNEPVFYPASLESPGRQNGFLNEPQSRQKLSDTSHPAELSLSKAPNNTGFTVTGEPDSAEKSETAFSPRGDTVPAFRSGMERVSDFFMRDSRRYDSGFERF